MDTSPIPRSRQLPLAVLGGVALLLLAYRGYGPRFATRPTDDLPPAAAVRVDLNAADRTELLQVPGIGPNLADAILTHRQARGRFESVDDLDGVKGIGGKTLGRLREWVRVEPTVARGQSEPAVERLERKPPAQPPPTGKLAEGDPPIDVNAASAEELQRLPGIGPTLAARIVAERAKRPFAAVEDLRRVSGIGPKTVEKLRPFVAVK
jgi:competence protein ComEA